MISRIIEECSTEKSSESRHVPIQRPVPFHFWPNVMFDCPLWQRTRYSGFSSNGAGITGDAGQGHGRRGALKLATSTKDFKTESESRPTYIQGEIF